ncbi:uncharacterized protein LOC108859843 [Raphanus sativus]|uniref:Uncharacterized protein LOC108859843 n=1 Tax=Raphanus sativus TaxID=3726 RepID=A0A6J0NZZ0_RAPSA|nr:uncharacterized protein LOC108859843 [Raphanus sativus]
MDITSSSINKPPLHEHPLFPSAMFTLSVCDGCHIKGYMYDSYFCNEVSCSFRLHKECAEAPLEINHHPSHPEHPLLLTNDSPTEDGTCNFCGQKLLSPYYTCPTCAFRVDFICGIKPSPCAIEHPVCHDHTLVFLKKRGEEKVRCELCKKSIRGPSYSCQECNSVYFHLDCVHLSREVNHPCHSNHPVKIIASESLKDDYAEKNCLLCSVEPTKMLYRCSVCNFTVCLGCTKLPPPLVVDHAKTHAHPLRLVSSKLCFTCRVCGIEDYETKWSYVCFDCDFVIHGNCIGFPRVININRHDHRISFTYHHGRGRPKCGVCQGDVSQYCGAYICSVCPNYTVHSRCAFDYTVWNGVELEGIPESSEEIALLSFKVLGHIMIRHFNEKHILLFLNNYDMVRDWYERLRCPACVRPLGFGPVYFCKECGFIIHEKCARLPWKKRLVFDPSPYTLEYNPSIYVDCKLCGMICDGFMYTSQGIKKSYQYIDVHCGSISEPLVHIVHSHPLYFGKRNYWHCDVCDRYADYMLTCCGDCGFYLCLYCATLPEKIWYMSDEHPLTLSCDGNESGENWCDVCESELDPSELFFACSDCELVLHVRCGLGDFSRLKPGRIYTFGERDYKVVINYSYTRPFCSHCRFRCKVPVILKDCDKDDGYICSRSCLSSSLGV